MSLSPRSCFSTIADIWAVLTGNKPFEDFQKATNSTSKNYYSLSGYAIATRLSSTTQLYTSEAFQAAHRSSVPWKRTCSIAADKAFIYFTSKVCDLKPLLGVSEAFNPDNK
jgi:hypothetical protein